MRSVTRYAELGPELRRSVSQLCRRAFRSSRHTLGSNFKASLGAATDEAAGGGRRMEEDGPEPHPQVTTRARSANGSEGPPEQVAPRQPASSL